MDISPRCIRLLALSDNECAVLRALESWPQTTNALIRSSGLPRTSLLRVLDSLEARGVLLVGTDGKRPYYRPHRVVARLDGALFKLQLPEFTERPGSPELAEQSELPEG